MLFNSFQFIVFFLVVFCVYWSLRGRARTYFFLVASYVFYGSWDYRFLSLIVVSTTVDFFAARGIHATTDTRRRRLFLLASIVANLGILGFFKYCNFFIDTFTVLLGRLGLPVHVATLHIVLPVGISFYTFQTMSYTIDVYRGSVRPTKDFVAFATFVAFFPQLVAGPIERFQRLYPQLTTPAAPSALFVRKGVFLLLQGYVKKVVIADAIAPAVEAAFGQAAARGSGELLEAAILFSCQIYCDFSGYSDIARGVAYLFGVELSDNFRAPFLSRSITEFWRRWHVSLSQWLRDYLYIPLGGNRMGPGRTYVNLMATMLLGGLWHGADWKFVVWGGLHGLLLALERRFLFHRSRAVPPAPTLRTWPVHLASWAATFAAVVLIFIFFRASSVGAAYDIVGRIASLHQLGAAVTLRLAATLGAILLMDWPVLWSGSQTPVLQWPLPVRVGLYTVLLLSLLVLSGHQAQTFIYFAF